MFPSVLDYPLPVLSLTRPLPAWSHVALPAGHKEHVMTSNTWCTLAIFQASEAIDPLSSPVSELGPIITLV